MPRGGARPGSGRRHGDQNVKTIEREKEADRVLTETRLREEAEAEQAKKQYGEAAAAGRKLAKSMLDDFMHIFASMAAKYQPVLGNRNRNEKKFKEWAMLAVDAASELAPYQSATFKSVAVVIPPVPDPNRDGATRLLTAEEAYRLMKNGGLINLKAKEIAPPAKKAARG